MSARLINKLDLPPDVVRICEATAREHSYNVIVGWIADEPFYAVHVEVQSLLGLCAVIVVRKDGDSDPRIVVNAERTREQATLYEHLFHGVGV